MKTDPIQTATVISQQIRSEPKIGLVLGSGFNTVISEIEIERAIEYKTLPGFAATTVPGHRGEVIVGRMGGVPVAVLNGRPHFYEGHSMQRITFPVRVLAALGVEALLLTNAAGGIRPDFRPGDFMCLTDHINLMGVNPLAGASGCRGEGFVDLSQVYEPKWAAAFEAAAAEAGIRLHKGIYCAVSGPSFETPAEIRAFARLGADAVGMSTVPEAVVAKQCGMQVAGLSCITNLAAGMTTLEITHEEVLSRLEAVRDKASVLVRRFADEAANITR